MMKYILENLRRYIVDDLALNCFDDMVRLWTILIHVVLD